MSLASPKLERRERAIEAARRQIRRLEIETHRVKASLARLEADYEDDVADTLTRRLRRRARAERELDAADEDWQERFDDAVAFESTSPAIENGRTQSTVAVLPFAAPPTEGGKPIVRPKSRARTDQPGARERTEPPPAILADPAVVGTTDTLPARPRMSRLYRKTAGPLVISCGLHAVAIVFCLSFTFVTLVQQRIPLFASPTESDDDIPAPLANVKIEPSKFEDDELQNTLSLAEEFNIADNLSNPLEPSQLGAGVRPTGDVGQLDMLPGDVGTLMSGGGKPSSGKPGGDLGNAIFFGARSKGDRFVFVVDN